jgi:hypothetical protein
VPASTPTTQAPARPAQSRAQRKVPGQAKARDIKSAVPPDYTLDQLAATFSSEDWEELYAYVDVINAMDDKSRYDEAWKLWAQSQDNQTAEQWRQYYEKVVRPQWLRDPEWKRKQVKEKVQKRYEESSSQSQTADQQKQKELHEEEEEAVQATSTATENRKAIKEAPARVTGEKLQGEPSKLSSEIKSMSSSMAQHESPGDVTAIYQNGRKRVRGDDTGEGKQGQKIPRDQSPPPKRQKSLSPVASGGKVQASTSKQSAEISSSDSSSLDEEDEQVNNQIMEDVKQSHYERHSVLDDDDVEEEGESVELEDFLDLEQSPALPARLDREPITLTLRLSSRHPLKAYASANFHAQST